MSRVLIYKVLVVIAGAGFALFGAVSLGFVRLDDRRTPRCKGDFQWIGTALKAYSDQAGRPPTTEQGLEALVRQPALEPIPSDWVQIMSKVPMDPWRRAYQYLELPTTEGVFRWELRSAGPDGITGNEDDRAEEFEWKGR